ncbi:MAG: DUF4435 domain-containing protein [Alistipes sp.]|nr:DUF4435 domain-containing protein [Alistipes sp.]
MASSRGRYYHRKSGKKEARAARQPQRGSGAQARGGQEGGPAAPDNDGLNRYRERHLSDMPRRLPRDPSRMHVEVFVEGYEDVAFWRGIFDDYESPRITFEINVPPRADLAKGKKVLLGMHEQCSPQRLLCLDSDFDYLFGETTAQSATVNCTQYMFHTYAYATENYLCYAPSLHNVCVKATKNDARIFDFERFMSEYSRIIHPLFLWYAYSARLKNENIFTLNEFRSSVKLNYLEVDDNGGNTLRWLERQVSKRLGILEASRPGWDGELSVFAREIADKGVTPETTYLYIQGHTLMDNVVIIMLNAVCDELKRMNSLRISASTKTGTALRNEISNYHNAVRNVRDVLLDNEQYKSCPPYLKLREDIERYLRGLGMLDGSRI